jgi:hypothetical protein
LRPLATAFRNDPISKHDFYFPSSSLSLSLTLEIALPSLFSPQSLRFADASAAPNPTPQMRSVGEACSLVLANIRTLVRFNPAYFDKLSVTSVEQHLGEMLAFLAFSELVIIALFDDPALIYRHNQQSVRDHQRERRYYHSRWSQTARLNPLAFLPSAWCSEGTVVFIICSAVS